MSLPRSPPPLGRCRVLWCPSAGRPQTAVFAVLGDRRHVGGLPVDITSIRSATGRPERDGNVLGIESINPLGEGPPAAGLAGEYSGDLGGDRRPALFLLPRLSRSFSFSFLARCRIQRRGASPAPLEVRPTEGIPPQAGFGWGRGRQWGFPFL